MMTRTSWKSFCLILTGNLFDHYDSNIYAMMVPLIAPLFFPQEDPVVGLLLGYSLLSVGIITRPLGAFVFGHLCRKHGPNPCLVLSLSGIALATGTMALLPTYATIGSWAPILLALLRGFQGFFGAGETTIAGLYALSFCPASRQGTYGGLYQSSTVLGIFLASACATVVTCYPDIALLWRVPFFLGFGAGCMGLYLRTQVWQETHFQVQPKAPSTVESFRILYEKKKLLLRIIAVSSFSYLTYSIPFVLMNSFLPLVSDVSLQEVMLMNTALLLVDMIACPLLGKLADRFTLTRVMKTAALALTFTLIPLFFAMQAGTAMEIMGIRIWIIGWGLVFLSPLYGWFSQVITTQDRYLLKGVGYQLGSEVFGRSLPAVCICIWYQTHSFFLVGLYPTVLAFGAYLSLGYEDLAFQTKK
jgi:MHS family proline/betaine transporter-like MFS transporter